MKTQTLLIAAGLLCLRGLAFGLATESIGPANDVAPQPGWPKGTVDLARHPTRVYAQWVNGNENFYFKAGADGISELLELFSKTRMRDRQLSIRPGHGIVKAFNGQEFEYNVSLQVLSGIALHARRRAGADAPLEPGLTIYVGEGLSLLNQLRIPANLLVTCAVPGAQIKETPKPLRNLWYGKVQFPDGTPASDLEHALTTRVTLWDTQSPDPFEMATLERDGSFRAAFSDDEITALKNGRTWLTVKIGNFLATPSTNDTQYPADSLGRVPAQAKPLQIPRPPWYFGRLLFDDNTPAVLQKTPWPGAEIHVDFPYAGWAKIDPEGYFQVSFEPDQFEALKSRKPSKNIYIPTEAQGQSVAKATFAPELLSPDKSKAGVVTIPKPVFAD